jgi:hypothetical protein
MRILIAIGVLALSACESTPPPSQVASATPAVAPVPGSDEERQAKADHYAKLQGYKITINKDGSHRYCKTWAETASRIKQEVICLSTLEMAQQEEKNQRDMAHPAISPVPSFVPGK